MFKNKILMITGGTGSFGNAVVRKFLSSDLKEIRIFSRDEKKQEDMRIRLKNKKLKFFIGDIRDKNSLRKSMKNVDYVFHAAALKQVPSCEFHPMEAVKTNIIGTENLIQVCVESKIKKVIMLSTDKAVYPVNAMGMSKAIMEKLMIAQARLLSNNETVFCATRYGNVMASRGSVIPLFIQQIKSNLPLTITDPNMTRFLMSLDESVELVLHAFRKGNQGDIFVQKSPASSLETLAKSLMIIFKYDKKITHIGTRHGEKLFETLVSREEMAKVISEESFYRIPADNRDLNYSSFFNKGKKEINNTLDYTSHNTKQLDTKEVIDICKNLKYVKDQLNE
jgi:UDP-N-acetylglucosamine 4,6-dehydratase/5-epimerase